MARRLLPYKPLTIKPASNLLAARCTADQVQINEFRAVENWEVLEKTKMCRVSGYTRLMASLFDNNADLHDPLEGSRQPFNFLWSYRTAIGLDKLFAATQNRLLAFNNSTGNWRIIWDGIGGPDSTACPDSTWWGAGFGDVIVFTNGQKDGCKYHIIDQPLENDGQAVATIPDLKLLKISQVGFVTHWNGLTFYCNLVEDGGRKSYRILWSDYQNPISIKPKESVSVAGNKDLAFGEVVLNAKELGNSILFYTNLGVWVGDKDDNAGMTFAKRYSPERPGDRTLAFPRAIVSTGAEHYFLGVDDIYVYSFYLPKPERLPWINKGSSVIFDDIDTSRCQVHCAGYDSTKKTIEFSWARKGESCPSKVLTVNVEFPFLSVKDYGVTAYGNFGESRQYSVRQFILDQCICTADQMDANGMGFVKEGGYCRPGLEVVPTCDNPPTCFWTNTGVDLDGVSVEDFDQPMDPNSLCARLAGLTLDDLCAAEEAADQCKNKDALIFAASGDLALKQADPDVYYRETLTDAAGCGAYAKMGYISLLRSGPLDFETEQTKLLSQLSMELYAEQQTVPSLINLKVGAAKKAEDPNKANAPGSGCIIMYETQEPIPMDCMNDLSPEEAKAQNVFPDKFTAWPLAMHGTNIYYEIWVSNPEHGDTGGACCIGSISMRVAAIP